MDLSEKKVLRIGHRGACGYEPENTIRSIERALELHVDVVECDIWLTTDDELVVIHDKRVDRTTDGTGKVTKKNV